MTAVAVTDPASTFWRSIVYIESTFSNGAVFTGSGVMVGPNDVLTAGHVLYMAQQGGAATKVRVIPAYDPSPYSTPYGEITSTSFHYFEDYDPQGSGWLMPGDGTPALAWSELDIGIIDLGAALGERTGWMTIDPTFSGGTVSVTGFPALYGRNMMTESGYASVHAVDSTILYGGLDLSPGNSGGPVWTESGDSARVVGVVSTAGWGASVKGTYDQLMQWIAGNDHLLPQEQRDGADGGAAEAPADTPVGGSPSSDSDGLPTRDEAPPQPADDTPPQPADDTPPQRTDDTPPATRDESSSDGGDAPADPPAAQNPAPPSSPGGGEPPAPVNRPPSSPDQPAPSAPAGPPPFYDRVQDGTAVFGGGRDAYSIVRGGSGYEISGPQGTYMLPDVERVTFDDGKVALDLNVDGAAAHTVKVIGAALGPENVRLHPEWVGVGLALFDAGMSVAEAAAFALGTPAYAARAASLGNADFISTIHANVVGRAPSEAEHRYYLGWLSGEGGAMTQAQLLSYAADTEANAARIDIAGLQATGVDYC